MKLINITDVCDIQVGKTPSRNEPSYWGKGSLWLSIADMNQGLFLEKTKETITDRAVKETKIKIVPAGTVLFSFKLSIGKVGITQVPMYTNEAIAAFIIKDSSKLDTKYLYYVLKGTDHTIGSKRAVMGKTLNKEMLKKIEIPLPSLEEQKRIVSELDAADALSKKRKQAITLLDDYLKAVFLEMFGDPVTNPKEWNESFLEEMYINKKEGTKCGPFGSALKKDEYVDNGIPVWTMDNIRGRKFVSKGCLYVNEEKYKELEKYSVKNGDIIISRAGTVGKMAIIEANFDKSVISTNLIKLSLNPKHLLPLYFVSLMNYCKGRVGRLKTGSDGSFTHMNTGVLDSLKFPVPPIDLQEKFAYIVRKAESLQKYMLAQAKELDGNFKALIQKTFNK